MSRVNALLSRTNDRRILCVTVAIDRHSDYATIQVLQNDQPIEIFSTTHGSIQDNRVRIPQPGKAGEILLTVEYPHGDSECLISYFDGDEFMESETFPIVVSPCKSIEEKNISVMTINTAPETFITRMNRFYNELNRSKSPWNIGLSCDDDIVLNIKSQGDKKTVVSFGEDSKEIIASDYTFTMFPDISPIILPKEVFWKKYSQYQANANLGIYELVNPGFISSPNIFYKVRISNLVQLSSFARKKEAHIGDFLNPLGTHFDDSWTIGEAELPVRGI